MGRARITMQRIQNDRARKVAFQNRTKGLMKKLSAFTSICEVDACLIIFQPKEVQPVIWPQDPTKLKCIIDKFESQKNENPPTNYDLDKFFEHRKNMVEAEISRVRREILKIKYPTWDNSFNSIGEEHLKEFISLLDTKLKACNQRINMLKDKHQTEANNFNVMRNKMPQGQFIPAPMKPVGENNQLAHSYPIQLDMGSESQMLHFDDPNIMQLIANNNGKVDSSNQVGVPLDCDKQIGVSVDSANQVGVHVNWTNQIRVHVDGNNYVHNSAAMNGAFDYDPKFNALEEDLQPQNYYYPALQNIPSQNVQHGAANLHTLPPLIDGFQTNDCYNMLEDQIFNSIDPLKYMTCEEHSWDIYAS